MGIPDGHLWMGVPPIGGWIAVSGENAETANGRTFPPIGGCRHGTEFPFHAFESRSGMRTELGQPELPPVLISCFLARSGAFKCTHCTKFSMPAEHGEDAVHAEKKMLQQE